MCSREIDQYHESRNATFITEEQLLAAGGLCRDPLCLPFFSYYDMFESLLKHKKISRSTIRKKLTAFYNLLTTNNIPHAPRSLAPSIIAYGDTIQSDLRSNEAFYNTSILVMFAYVFGVRLELFAIGRNRVLACQYFGVKRKTVKRVYMSDCSYFMLKKVLTKTNTFSTKICSDIDCKSKDASGSRRRLREEQWNKYYNKSECIYKFKPSTINNKILRRMEDELDSIDSDCNDYANMTGTCAIIEEVLSSMEHSKDSERVNDTSTFSGRSAINLKNSRIDTDQYLNDWTYSICQDKHVNEPEPEYPTTKRNTVIASITHTSVIGMLKFYSEVKEYGFITTSDKSEIFVHKADLVKQNIETRSFAYCRKFYDISIKFDIEEYQGKTDKHRKAINMVILNMTPIIS